MLSIERSGYYSWVKRQPSKQSIANQKLDKKIIDIFNRHHHRYGYPRITDELHSQGETCSKNRVFHRMCHLGLKAKAKKKFKTTTDSNHKLPVADNLLNRDFSATAPNQKWVGDITYGVPGIQGKYGYLNGSRVYLKCPDNLVETKLSGPMFGYASM